MLNQDFTTKPCCQHCSQAMGNRDSSGDEECGAMEERCRRKIIVAGTVQGVGFRPFVFRLANELGLVGFIENSKAGVEIEVEGSRYRIETFIDRLTSQSPIHGKQQSVTSSWLASKSEPEPDFFIAASSGAAFPVTAWMTPDLATCKECIREILSPDERRFRHPFAHCTNCGPRFSVIESLPYDRSRTAMRRFELCPQCHGEYMTPANRRFHAQGIACHHCGPNVRMVNVQNRTELDPESAITNAVQMIVEGKIVAVKGMGGFTLFCDATNQSAVQRLRNRKGRPAKPLAIMVRTLEDALQICEISPEEATLLESAAAPIVILRKRLQGKIANAVAPGNPFLGVMLANTPLHHILLNDLARPLVATSGNNSDEPICTDIIAAMRSMGTIADGFLDHDRAITRHCDDSIVKMTAGKPRLLRCARGYAPLLVPSIRDLPCILAVGAHQKNTVALSMGKNILISQHIGNLDTLEGQTVFENVIQSFLQTYDAAPVAIAHDWHPDYASTVWAKQVVKDRGSKLFGLPLIPVQHHVAHFAACRIENSVDAQEEVLGVIWDGSGHGGDGTTWGGEFLVGSAHTQRRLGHLKLFPLPGGELAVRQPVRSAFAILHLLHRKMPSVTGTRVISDSDWKTLEQMMDQGVNCPMTSSMGRLFDAVASILGLRQIASFEGQAAMDLEFAASQIPIAEIKQLDWYPFPASLTIENDDSQIVLDWAPMITGIVNDLHAGESAERIAARFHWTAARAILQIAQRSNCRKVALSGGCFQNSLLLELAITVLTEHEFEVLTHSDVPTNDGGIALGQIHYATQFVTAEISGGELSKDFERDKNLMQSLGSGSHMAAST